MWLRTVYVVNQRWRVLLSTAVELSNCATWCKGKGKLLESRQMLDKERKAAPDNRHVVRVTRILHKLSAIFTTLTSYELRYQQKARSYKLYNQEEVRS